MTTSIVAPLSRIMGRYIAGALVTYGLIAPDAVGALEPELIALAGAVIGAAVEVAYTLARRKGWTT